jgi:hypothetical protein
MAGLNCYYALGSTDDTLTSCIVLLQHVLLLCQQLVRTNTGFTSFTTLVNFYSSYASKGLPYLPDVKGGLLVLDGKQLMQ